MVNAYTSSAFFSVINIICKGRWNVPGLPMTGIKTTRGPFPGSDLNQLTFIAEQVSHHPPVSAFYAEHPGKKISLNAHIWTKSSFLGLSIGLFHIDSVPPTFVISAVLIFFTLLVFDRNSNYINFPEN